MGAKFEVVVRPVEEVVPRGIAPRAVAAIIAENKAKAYSDLAKEHVVITADTIVVLKGDILGKPKDEMEAIEMLQRLSGETHQVITGITLFHLGKFNSFSEQTSVTFRELRSEEIRYYLKNDPPLDKAGAYGIQDWMGKIGITRIEGDYYNVMGLPTARLYEALTNWKK
ncbi:UNVERIFIED_CONTAM: hypothetical protein GTU68_061160 [Idotea baltica]|nr:hypothetical protein [Idotea baltica]